MRWLPVLFLSLSLTVFGQDYSVFKNTISQLQKVSAIPDSTLRSFEAIKWWNVLHEQSQIPLVVEDSVAFFYRGDAKSVVWFGDFNGWGSDQNFFNVGKQITHTKIWMLKTAFPKDARLDYKLILNGNEYILDPENPKQQWSGLGGGSPNSELRMPLWKECPELFVKNTIPHGAVTPNLFIHSQLLKYPITYNVYLPNGYKNMGKLPVIFVTDGYEYLHPKLGNMATVLDNLIAEKKLKPIIAVFVDNREPANRDNNRRMQELAMNSAYLDFFVNELIPTVEKNYPITKDRSKRAILGTSMGGLTSAYFAFSRPDIFGLAGIQSPAFRVKPQIYELCSTPVNPKIKISMTTGIINDTGNESRKMKEIFDTNHYDYRYREVNEGHSWGNWRNLLDDILIDFFGAN